MTGGSKINDTKVIGSPPKFSPGTRIPATSDRTADAGFDPVPKSIHLKKGNAS